MELIESKTLATAAASIEFTSIPSTFTDLVFVTSLRSSSAGAESENLDIRFNSSSSNFSFRMLRGSGSAATSASEDIPFFAYIPRAGTTANTFGNAQLYIPNYSGSTNKSYSVDFVTEHNATAAWAAIVAGLWSNTAAINSVSFVPATGNLVAGSIISLYGITKGSDGIVTTS
jgi:hypothetical protein